MSLHRFFGVRQCKQSPWRMTTQSHPSSRRNKSTVSVKRVRFWVEIQLQKNTRCRINHRSIWLSVQSGTESYGEDQGQIAEVYRRHQLTWQPTPQLSQMKISSSSHKQTTIKRPQKIFQKNSRGNIWQNWWQTRNHLHWRLVSGSSQRSTETYVILNQRNQSKRAKTRRARFRFGAIEPETEKN